MGGTRKRKKTEEQEAPHVDALPPELAGATVTLRLPRLAHRIELVAAARRLEIIRHRAAALALCWPHLARQLKQRGVIYDGNLAELGLHSMELLIENGVEIRHLVAHGLRALELCAADLPGLGGEDQIAKDAAKGN